MGVVFKHRGDFKKIEKFFRKMSKEDYLQIMERYAQKGVDALASATPIDSGVTANSWGYEIVHEGKGTTIYWRNSNENKGVNIALILQYGHGTGTGGYVQGRDYINPAIRPVFDKMAEEIWEEVTSA
jgi:hypothetical protein